uniref:Cubilin n=1 Tax=Heterorhabditis bacteriophora TaxID=37862 RepID=A0A1I7X8V6_HETBA
MDVVMKHIISDSSKSCSCQSIEYISKERKISNRKLCEARLSNFTNVDNPNNEIQYKCLCEWGYKLSDDNQNPTCVDINECLLSPCHPGVDCINLPGTFQCAGCPKGYHGNGQLCADVDECAADVYPCSLNPRVPCFNTLGSFQCGSCPAGYRGNGRTCRKDSACDGSPCHPIAQCIEYENSMYPGGFVCHCPAGTMGNGIGENGCVKNNSTICLLEGRCMNGGTCKPLSNSEYRCACAEFYYGDRCEKVSLCISSPCKNGGNCEDTGDGTMTCNCPPGFFGSYCQVEENCGYS